MDELRINIWYYVAGWFGLACLFAYFLTPLSSIEPGLPIFVGMAFSFVCVYAVFSKVERGKVATSDGIRLLVAIITLMLGSGAVYLPFQILLGDGTVLQNIIFVVWLYIGGAIGVILLLTLLAWVNDSSPWKELQKCFRLL